MRVVVTRPQADGERTAATLEARGHEVLHAPLMIVEPIPAELSGNWSAIIVTSGNAPAAIANNPKCGALLKLPVFAVGQHSAETARAAGFGNITSAHGGARDLLRLVAERNANDKAPLLYLAGEDRAADLAGELASRGSAVDVRVVYRVVTAPFPLELIAALEAEDIEGVLHFSRRSAESYLAGARSASVLEPALDVRHFCLSEQVAEPLHAAHASQVAVAPKPDEAALLALLPPPQA